MKKNYRIWFYPLIIMELAFLNKCEKDDEITDKDDNTYTAVTIGTQVWIIENLKTTKYNDGTTIPNITDNEVWANLTTPGYCWYDNDASTFKAIYGALYNWYAVNTGKLCPLGWHIPTRDDYTTLMLFLDTDGTWDNNDAGGKLKETGTIHWLSPNIGATNESGFTALPGGGRQGYAGLFVYIGLEGIWWSSTESTSTNAWSNFMYYETDGSYMTSTVDKGNAFSVRCIKN
jgi:uncharacterized protein (TIGR02145 family)